MSYSQNRFKTVVLKSRSRSLYGSPHCWRADLSGWRRQPGPVLFRVRSRMIPVQR